MTITSEQQAREIAALHDGAKVFWYEHRPSRLTLFMVVLPDGTRLMQDPRAAEPRNQNGE